MLILNPGLALKIGKEMFIRRKKNIHDKELQIIIEVMYV